MPEPTKTPSAPSCMQSAASAGVAIPPAVNVTTGRRPCSATQRTSSTGGRSSFASADSPPERSVWSPRMPPKTERKCVAAVAMSPGAAPLLRLGVQPLGAGRLEPGDAAEDGAHVRDRVDDVAGARLALRPDHRGALGDAAQRLAEVRAAADERDRERPLVDVMLE